jgi:HK97 family phage major capsid protein
MSHLLSLLQNNRAKAVADEKRHLDSFAGNASRFDAAAQRRAKELNDAVKSLDGDIAREESRIESEKRTCAVYLDIEESRTTSTRSTAGGVKIPAAVVTRDEQVYRPDVNEVSYFRDLHTATRGDWAAAERLDRNNRQMSYRALSTTAGAGGQFAPPLWLTEEWVALARAGRVTADLSTKDVLPDGISSVNLPVIATGTSTAVQATQNTALSQTDLTTSSVSSGITLIGGKQISSLQLLRQGGVAMDRVILGDLAADYARQLDTQVISGSGASGQLRGLLNGAGVGSTAYTTATPKVIDTTTPANSFYYAVIRAINAVNTTRFLPPTAIVMHPRRWAWLLESLDNSGRPLVLTDGNAFNALGVETSKAAQGPVGNLANLPVYIDPNIPTNLGAGTNQDPCFVLRASDVFLWETEIALESFDSTYADQASVLFRALSFSAFISDRYGAAVNVINGTGMVAPTL